MEITGVFVSDDEGHNWRKKLIKLNILNLKKNTSKIITNTFNKKMNSVDKRCEFYKKESVIFWKQVGVL